MNSPAPDTSRASDTAHAQGTNLKIASRFGAAGVVATLLLFPYLLAIMPLKFAALARPLWIVMLAQSIQAGVICLLLGWAGLALGANHGLDAPWLRAWVSGQPHDAAVRAHWRLAIVLGLAAGLLIVAASLLFPHPAAATSAARPLDLAWRGALASFYGGTVEEIECRLLIVSLLVWLLAWLNRRRASPWMFVTAIALAALAFGAGHLPGAFAAGMAHAPVAIARIVLLNALAGSAAGAVFWRWGIEHAMVTHFSADLIVHVALPLAGLA